MPFPLMIAALVQANDVPLPSVVPPISPVDAYVALPERRVVFAASKRRQRRFMACLAGASTLSAGSYALARRPAASEVPIGPSGMRSGWVITSGTLLGVAVTCGVGAAWVGPR
ncbi:MAG: hypothetical protein KTR31_39940 [Myxococcales bacterium]|nr:hypothetical protein [Myxococcales bacterium]